MIHLAASNACLALPRSVEDLVRNLGSHFSRSYHKQQKFMEFQEFFHVKIHKILHPSVTRWLSLRGCVDRVLEQYVPLREYLRETVMSDPSRTTDEMLLTMNNKFTKIYLEFLSYTLGLLNNFNTLFQSEASLLYKVKHQTECLLKTLCTNYIGLEHIKSSNIFKMDHTNPRHILENEKIYLGVLATSSLLEIKDEADRQELNTFFNSCTLKENSEFLLKNVCFLQIWLHIQKEFYN